MGRSSNVAAFSSVNDHSRKRLSAARNIAAASSSVMGAGEKSRGAVSIRRRFAMLTVHFGTEYNYLCQMATSNMV